MPLPQIINPNPVVIEAVPAVEEYLLALDPRTPEQDVELAQVRSDLGVS